MAETLVCPKCKSHKVIPRASVRGDVSLYVEVYEDPDATVFKYAHHSGVTASVCGECGYIELYAEDPQELYAARLAAGEG